MKRLFKRDMPGIDSLIRAVEGGKVTVFQTGLLFPNIPEPVYGNLSFEGCAPGTAKADLFWHELPVGSATITLTPTHVEVEQ